MLNPRRTASLSTALNDAPAHVPLAAALPRRRNPASPWSACCNHSITIAAVMMLARPWNQPKAAGSYSDSVLTPASGQPARSVTSFSAGSLSRMPAYFGGMSGLPAADAASLIALAAISRSAAAESCVT